MYIPEIHDRAWRNRPTAVLGDRLPTTKEALALVLGELPTASRARQKELAEALVIVVANEPPPPPTPARPARTLSELRVEWCAATPEARRIFNGKFSEFLNAVPWRR